MLAVRVKSLGTRSAYFVFFAHSLSYRSLSSASRNSPLLKNRVSFCRRRARSLPGPCRIVQYCMSTVHFYGGSRLWPVTGDRKRTVKLWPTDRLPLNYTITFELLRSSKLPPPTDHVAYNTKILTLSTSLLSICYDRSTVRTCTQCSMCMICGSAAPREVALTASR